ncbi:hypothetical protein HgNV_072 [Homarus gammarus nudivirus]|uniref:Uncharacterized protein n=1 Tax=Homarus gammarus nudivirus TaxID=2509616 RepID=A0A411HBB6_9VIRU|nr:hypothetical protein KM727_gp72 [Homarus gammarus nudivirus]QBB28677.1 hypothetical protein HgNV_072 [Homarus gammarus nudivirus]
MYNSTLSKYQNMEMFHNYVDVVNVWALYNSLGVLYECTPNITVHNNADSVVTWELCTKDRPNWEISREMNSIILLFTDEYMPKISYEEFEAYALCKIFLLLLHEENIKRFPLMCKFKNIKTFLKCIDMLYFQKFNIAKIKLLFSQVFFDDVYVSYKNNKAIQFDISNILSTKHDNNNITIKLKRLQPYVEYINAYKIKNVDEAIIDVIQKFNSEDIISVNEFYELCQALYTQSLQKYSMQNMKVLSQENKCIDDMVNRLNKLYANIVIVVLLKQKEDSIVYHKQLYSDLQTIC